MDIKQLSQQLDNLQNQPPFETWNPQYCGEMPITIKADGSWFYMGSAINRMPLVKLFASVLINEQDSYYLKTPAEKVSINVEDAPFIVTSWQTRDTEQGPAILVTTNLDHQVVINQKHPIVVNDNGHLYVPIIRGLVAKVHRNVFYQWAELATETNINQQPHLALTSGEQQFSIGKL